MIVNIYKHYFQFYCLNPLQIKLFFRYSSHLKGNKIMFLFYHKQSKNKYFQELGFTLFELLIVIVLIGILVAIATPSFFAMVNRKRVDDALNNVSGALKEAQREGMRKSKNCNVILDNENIVSGCLINGQRTIGNVKYDHNLTTDNEIPFNFRGEVEFSDGLDKIIVFYTEGVPDTEDNDNRTYQRCLVISNGLGLMRVGNYPSNQTTLDIDDCTTKQYE